MPTVRARRTLVKSPPELWAELSDAEALARRMEALGEIRITRLDPESTVAWEGERARGSVEIEPSGWGTRVTLTAETATATVDPPPPATRRPPRARAAEPPSPALADSLLELEALADSLLEPPDLPDLRPELPSPGRTGWRLGRLGRLFSVRPWPAPPWSPAAEEPEPDLPDPQPVPDPGRQPAPAPAPDPLPRPEPLPAPDPAPQPPPAPQPVPPLEPAAARSHPAQDDPRPTPLPADELDRLLTAVLDDLGAAHHRPFSRG